MKENIILGKIPHNIALLSRYGNMCLRKCVRKLPVTWGKAVFFAGYSGFLHYLQLASLELAAIWPKWDEKRNSKKDMCHMTIFFIQKDSIQEVKFWIGGVIIW